MSSVFIYSGNLQKKLMKRFINAGKIINRQTNKIKGVLYGCFSVNKIQQFVQQSVLHSYTAWFFKEDPVPVKTQTGTCHTSLHHSGTANQEGRGW